MNFLRRLFGTTSTISMADASTQVKQYIESNPVVVFSKSYCPFCTSTKSLLQRLGAKSTVLELDQVDGGSAMQDALQELNGQRTVPNVYIGQQHIGGNSEVQGLSESGDLEARLKAAGAL